MNTLSAFMLQNLGKEEIRDGRVVSGGLWPDKDLGAVEVVSWVR